MPLREVKAKARLTRYHGDCYIFAMLAMGFIDVVIEGPLNRWDIAAIFPIVEGAGGIVTGWDGEPLARWFAHPGVRRPACACAGRATAARSVSSSFTFRP